MTDLGWVAYVIRQSNLRRAPDLLRVSASRVGERPREAVLRRGANETDRRQRAVISDVSPDGTRALLQVPEESPVGDSRGGADVRWVPYLLGLGTPTPDSQRGTRLLARGLSDPRLVWSGDSQRFVLSSPEGTWLLDRDGRLRARIIAPRHTEFFLWGSHGHESLLCARTMDAGGRDLPPDRIEYAYVSCGAGGGGGSGGTESADLTPVRISANEAARRFGPSFPMALRLWKENGQTGATILPAPGGDPVVVSGIFQKRSSLPIGEISDRDRLLHILITNGKINRREITPGEFVRYLGWCEGGGRRYLVGQWGLEGYWRSEDDPRYGDIVRTSPDGRQATRLYRPKQGDILVWFKSSPIA